MDVAPKGLILAAGVGSRLMPLTADRPKVLVEVGGKCLLQRQLELCCEVSLSEVVIVAGYRSDAVRRFLDENPPQVPVTVVDNDCYETINNAYSVLIARARLDGEGFVKLDGDLLLSAEILRSVLASPYGSAAAIDTTARLDDEAMKACIDHEAGRITALGKWLAAEQSSGESIGVEKIAAGDSTQLFDAIDRLVVGEGRTDAYYEDVYHSLLAESGWILGAVDVGDQPWAEIDDAADLAAAERLIRQRDQ